MRAFRLIATVVFVGIALLANSMGWLDKDHELFNEQVTIPVDESSVYELTVPKNSKLTIEVTQGSDQQISVYLLTEGNYNQLSQILESGEGDPLSVPTILDKEGTEIKASGIDLSKGKYFLCMENLSEKELVAHGKIVIRN